MRVWHLFLLSACGGAPGPVAMAPAAPALPPAAPVDPPPPLTSCAAAERLFGAAQVDPAWISPEFRAAADFRKTRAWFEAELGRFVAATACDDTYLTLRFERGEQPAQLRLDAQGRLVLLRTFGPPKRFS